MAWQGKARRGVARHGKARLGAARQGKARKFLKKQTEVKKMEDIKAIMQKPEEFKRPHIEEGFYSCECVEVKRLSEGTFGERIGIICKVPSQDVNLIKVVYLKLTPDSACTRVLEAFGIDFQDGQEFQFSTLVGRKAIAVVEDYVRVNLEGKEETVSSITKFKRGVN